jgi:fructokinase
MQVADLVKINDDEATLMAATYKQESIVPWLLEEMEVKMVALTHGAKGATIYTRTAQTSHGGFAQLVNTSTSERDNIGAGDSFTALLIRGQLAGVRAQKIVCAANRYAAFVASQRGATPSAPDSLFEELARLLDLTREKEARGSRS